MSINSRLFTSQTDLWATPQNFFEKLNVDLNLMYVQLKD